MKKRGIKSNKDKVFHLIYDSLYEYMGRSDLSYMLYKSGIFSKISEAGKMIGVDMEIIHDTKDVTINLTINV